MKNMLYKAKGALALTLAVSICGAQCGRAGDTCEGVDRGGEGGIAAAEADRRGSIGEGEKA